MAGRNLLADTPGSSAPVVPAGRNLLADPAPTPEQERADRLRKIALASMKASSGEPGASDRFSDSFTLGLMKPVSGAATGLGNLLTGQSGFGEGYTAGAGAYQDYLDEATKNAGWGGTAASLAGSVVAGGPKAIANAPSMLRSAVNAGTLSGIQGAAQSDGSLADRAIQTGESALLGAGLGTVGHYIGDKVGSWWSRRNAAKAQTYKTAADIKAAGKAKYGEVDQSGVVYPRAETDNLLQNVDKTLTDLQATPGLDDRAIAAVEKLKKDWSGKPINPSQLEKVRRWVDRRLIGGAQRGDDLDLAYGLRNTIDDFTKNTNPINPVTGQPDTAANAALNDARSLYARFYRAKDVEGAAAKAQRQAQKTGSALTGGNIENTRRQQFEKLGTKIEEGKTGGYSEDEVSRIAQIAKGTVGRDIGRLGGTISPLRGSVPALLHLAGAPLTGGLSTVVGGIGEVAAQLGRHATTKEIQELSALVRDPSGRGLATDPATVAEIRNRLASIMAGAGRAAQPGGGP